MKSKSSQTKSTAPKTQTSKKTTLRDLTAKQSGDIKGGAASLRKFGRT